MEKYKKKKILNGKRKVGHDKNLDEKIQTKKCSKLTNISCSQEHEYKNLNHLTFEYNPKYIYTEENYKYLEKTKKVNEDDYLEKISEKMKKMDQLNTEINLLVSKRDKILEFMKEIGNNIRNEEKKILQLNNKINDEDFIVKSKKNEIHQLKSDEQNITAQRDMLKKSYEIYKSNELFNYTEEIKKERNNLTNLQIENENNKIQALAEVNNIQNKEQEINKKKLELEKNIEEKNNIKEQYEKANQIAINDNKFCHDNFYSLLTFFPYYKNVAFINTNNNEILSEEEEKKEFDENRIIIEEELENDLEKENLKNIKILLAQRENIDKKTSFKILKDRKTLQIEPKEKYKFKKIFSTINNNYFAEPWDSNKYISLKLSTINSYFNEFNLTAISNNYFVIYFVPILEKTSINNEVYKLYHLIKNNEYIDKNIMIKISAISETNYINLQNVNQESKIRNQLLSIKNENTHIVYGFLYEFIKTNRLNKKNIFRIYNFDYSYPQAIDMMKNINKYYAKKKRKKTGVYKKVIRKGQGKQKKKQNERSTSNNNNINNKPRGKSNINNNNNNKKNNLNKVQPKKTININIANMKKNNTFITNNQQNNKSNNNKNLNTSVNIVRNNRINRNENSKKIKSSKKEINKISEDKKIIKSGSQIQSQKKESKVININNNLKIVKLDEKIKSTTPRKTNSTNKKSIKKQTNASLVFNDLKLIKPEHTLVIHDIYADFVNSNEFKQVIKACGLLNNSEK